MNKQYSILTIFYFNIELAFLKTKKTTKPKQENNGISFNKMLHEYFESVQFHTASLAASSTVY